MTSAETWIRERVGGQNLSWADLVSLITYAQGELGVTADGKPGARTLIRLDQHIGDDTPGKQLPIPKGRKATHALYGNPTWERTKGRGVDLDNEWERVHLRRFTLHTGKVVRLHRLVGAEFVAIFREACEVSGYTPKSVQTFNPRTIGRSQRLSMHALGVAADFDPNDNWLGGVRRRKINGRWALTDEPALMLQNPGFSETWEKHGWTWGHRWSFVDTHHIQRCSP